jgi:hypothetical protein
VGGQGNVKGEVGEGDRLREGDDEREEEVDGENCESGLVCGKC